MLYKILSIGWNANPETPDLSIREENNNLILDFYLNSFLHPQFREAHKCSLSFLKCSKYFYSEILSEAYLKGQYRFKPHELPFGEFYEINTNKKMDFPSNALQLENPPDEDLIKHYLFFFKQGIFECLAQDYKLHLLQKLD